MFINPNHAIQEGWVTFPEWMSEEFKQKCVQPDAIDFTADRMFAYGTSDDKANDFIISELHKTMRPSVEMSPDVDRMGTGDVYWKLHRKSYFDVMSDFYVDVPTGVVALLIVRSTLSRNGLYITSGLFDSNFSGHLGATIHNRGQAAYIAPHTRIAQVAFITAEDSGIAYAGSYNTTVGQHWKEKEIK